MCLQRAQCLHFYKETAVYVFNILLQLSGAGKLGKHIIKRVIWFLKLFLRLQWGFISVFISVYICGGGICAPGGCSQRSQATYLPRTGVTHCVCVCVNKYTLAFTCLLCMNLYLDMRAIVWGNQSTICFTSVVWVLGLQLRSSGTSWVISPAPEIRL